MSTRTLYASERWWEERGEFLFLDRPSEAPAREEWTRVAHSRPSEKLVYFMESSHTGLIKIGISNDPWRRLYEIGVPPYVNLIAIESGGDPRESFLHRRFADYSIFRLEDGWRFNEAWVSGGSEWFVPATALLAYIFGWSE